MPPADRLLAFIGVALVLIVVPGPSVLFVISFPLTRLAAYLERRLA